MKLFSDGHEDLLGLGADLSRFEDGCQAPGDVRLSTTT